MTKTDQLKTNLKQLQTKLEKEIPKAYNNDWKQCLEQCITEIENLLKTPTQKNVLNWVFENVDQEGFFVKTEFVNQSEKNTEIFSLKFPFCVAFSTELWNMFEEILDDVQNSDEIYAGDLIF